MKLDERRRAGLNELFRHLLPQRTQLVVILVMSLAGAALSLTQPILVRDIIARVSASQALGALPWLLGAVMVGGAVLAGVRQYLIQRVAETAIRSARGHVVRHLLRLPVAQLDQRRTGDLVSRVSNDTTSIRNMLSQGLVESVAGVFTLIGAVVAMLLLDPLLFVIAAGASLVAVVVVIAVTQRIERASLALQNVVGELTADADRALRAVRTLRAANATDREAARVAAGADKAWAIGLDVARTTAVMAPASSVAMQLSILAVLGVGGVRVAAGDLSVADLVSFIMFLFMLIMPLGQIFGTIGGVGEALGGATRIAEVLNLPAEDDSGADPDADWTRSTVVEFDGVSFRYASGDGDAPMGRQATLQDVSFTVGAGQKVAIVGPSGAGKSTILHLVARFYDPSAGTLRFAGHDGADVSRYSVRRHIAYVEQEAPVISGTLRDNLTLMAPDADDEALLKILADVDLLGVVERAEEGLDSNVGESGVLLSGGERQRLALARALLGRPDVLLLDEATSNLDGVHEEEAQALIDRWAADSARIVVAHRLATVLDSDVIVVVQNGRVVARGSHTELMHTSSVYQDLARTQLVAAGTAA